MGNENQNPANPVSNLLGTISGGVKEETTEDLNKLRDFIHAGMHLGYSRSSRHPQTAKYVFGVRNNVQIIDVLKIHEALSEAGDFIKKLGMENKQILFVGTKEEAQVAVETEARRLGMPFINLRWLGGTLTNFKEVRRRLDTLDDLSEKQKTGELLKYKKKERVRIEEKMEKMASMFGGLKLMKTLPAALVVVDSKQEEIAIAEAKAIKIPVVALMNTDCNPLVADYPVPGNDASSSSIKLFLSSIGNAYLEGQKNLAGEAEAAEPKA